MKVGIAQIDTTVGDFDGNVSRIAEAHGRAAAAGADLVLYPELAIPGYPPMDLLERPAFVQANLRALQDAGARLAGGPDAIVGFAEPNRLGPGKPLHNAAAFLSGGKVLAVHRKALLPTYDVFDEDRYFQPRDEATVVERPYGRVGVTICEDIWNDPGVWAGAPYRDDPVARLAALKPDLVANVSASPYHAGKARTRLALGQSVARRVGAPVAYANQVGGNDGLIFDGESFVVAADGGLRALGRAFAEDLLVVDPAAPGPALDPAAVLQRDEGPELVEALCLGLRDFLGKLGFRSVVLGVSGGVDSAVVAALAARALGPQAVTGISMPSRYTSAETRSDAAELCRNLGISFHEISLEPVFEAYLGVLSGALGGRPGGLTEENLQARIRGALLMAWSNRTGALVLNTGNKSELAVGYSTLYGDMVGGLAVIGDLDKARVYRVARALDGGTGVIPRGILERPPSAELRPDQKDEDSLPPYPVLDPLLEAMIVGNLDGRDLVQAGFPRETVAWVTRMVAASEYKRRQAPLSLKVTPKAFGLGRRYPIVQRFREDLP